MLSTRPIKAAILKHGNPFAAEGDKLHIVITHAYIHDECTSDLECRCD